jgi:hypothetical protein
VEEAGRGRHDGQAGARLEQARVEALVQAQGIHHEFEHPVRAGQFPPIRDRALATPGKQGFHIGGGMFCPGLALDAVLG